MTSERIKVVEAKENRPLATFDVVLEVQINEEIEWNVQGTWIANARGLAGCIGVRGIPELASPVNGGIAGGVAGITSGMRNISFLNVGHRDMYQWRAGCICTLS